MIYITQKSLLLLKGWGGEVHPHCDKFWLGDTEAPGPALACCRMIPGLEISAEIPEGRWKTPPAVTPGVSLCDSRAVPSPISLSEGGGLV